MSSVGRKRALALSKVDGLLEPGPVVLLTTSHKGAANVMPMSWHTLLEFEPPLVCCVVSENDFSFAALMATRQCALNIPTVELAAQVVGCGNTSGAQVDKFTRFGLTQAPASLIAPPLISECYANLECRVVADGQIDEFPVEVVSIDELQQLNRVQRADQVNQKRRQTLAQLGIGAGGMGDLAELRENGAHGVSASRVDALRVCHLCVELRSAVACASRHEPDGQRPGANDKFGEFGIKERDHKQT